MEMFFGAVFTVAMFLCIAALYIHWREPEALSEPLRLFGAAIVWPCLISCAARQIGRRCFIGGAARTPWEVWGILLIWLVIGGLAITLFIRSESIGLSILVLVCVTFAWYWLLWAIFGGLNRIVAH